MPLVIKKDGEYVKEDTLTTDESAVVCSIKRHITLMLVDDWYITLTFMDVEDEAMATTARPEYRTATIEADIKQIGSQWEYLDNYARHELLHLLVWSYFDIAGTMTYKNASKALIKLEEAVIYQLEHMPLWAKVYKEE